MRFGIHFRKKHRMVFEEDSVNSITGTIICINDFRFISVLLWAS